MNDVQHERTMLDAAELGGIVSDNATDTHTEAWVTAAGLEGAILEGYNGLNGYVRLPEDFRERRIVADEPDIEAPGGITYGMDTGGWIGFDTGHSWDVWLDPDVSESKYVRTMREHGMTSHLDADPEWSIVWTIEKLRVEVERLAAEVQMWCASNPEYESWESADEKHERVRREMRRFGALAGIHDRAADASYDHEKTTAAIRRVMTPTVAEVEQDRRDGWYASEREYEWRLADARRREQEE